jgi:hypothetical protein
MTAASPPVQKINGTIELRSPRPDRAAASFRLIFCWMGQRSGMLEDFKEIPIVEPPATDQALYEMLGLIFRGDAKPPS